MSPEASRERKPIYPPVFFLVALLLMIGLHLLLPIRTFIAAPYRYLGLVPLALGLAVVLHVDRTFRRAGTTIKPFERSSKLLVDGPYRISRNPIYLGLVVALAGVAVVCGSITPFMVVPAFAFLIDRRFIRAEEAQLEETFGQEYDAYKRRVRRWLG